MQNIFNNENVILRSSNKKLGKNLALFRKNNKVKSEFYITESDLNNEHLLKNQWKTINELDLNKQKKIESQYNNLSLSFFNSLTISTIPNLKIVSETSNDTEKIIKKRRSRYESGYYSLSNESYDPQLSSRNLSVKNNFTDNLMFDKPICLQTCSSSSIYSTSTTSINSISEYSDKCKKSSDDLQQSFKKNECFKKIEKTNQNFSTINAIKNRKKRVSDSEFQSNMFVNRQINKTKSINLQDKNCFEKNISTDYEEFKNHLSRFKKYSNFMKSTESVFDTLNNKQKKNEKHYSKSLAQTIDSPEPIFQQTNTKKFNFSTNNFCENTFRSSNMMQEKTNTNKLHVQG